MSDKEHAHQLLEQLAPDQLAALVQLMEVMVPAAEDTETLSQTERKKVGEANDWLKRNPPIPHEQILADLGLTVSDWEKMQEPVPVDAPRRNG